MTYFLKQLGCLCWWSNFCCLRFWCTCGCRTLENFILERNRFSSLQLLQHLFRHPVQLDAIMLFVMIDTPFVSFSFVMVRRSKVPMANWHTVIAFSRANAEINTPLYGRNGHWKRAWQTAVTEFIWLQWVLSETVLSKKGKILESKLEFESVKDNRSP